MLSKRMGMLALGIISASQAMAEGQADSKGFVEDSRLTVNLRNAYINRDYKNDREDKSEWGQAFMGNFASGFTQGTVGVGVDAFALYGIRWMAARVAVVVAVSISSSRATVAQRPMTCPVQAQR
ncbi:hypothetical protein PSA5_16390 [Pseudomonas syringae pv. actinidiae]|nr:hypothetical protein PSA5_16390 [Pseudomonas syringae pv. actinidiae]